MSPRTDTLFRKWQQRYGISEQAFHALWGILAAVEHEAELERHNGISHQVFPQSQPLDVDERPSDGWLFDGMIGADAEFASIGNGSNPQPNTDENFISGGSNIELFDDDILVGGYNMEVAYVPEVQPVSDNLDIVLGDTSILAEQLPTQTPLPQISSWGERLPNGRQPTVYQHFDQAQISYVTPSATTVRKKRNSAQDAAESAIGHKRQKSTKQCIKCWISKRSCDNVGGHCKTCVAAKIPQEICIRTRLANYPVFDKWKDATYSVRLKWLHLHWKPFTRLATLRHEENGPTITVDAYEFCGYSPDEMLVYWKEKDGWDCAETTTFGLKTCEIDLTDYINQHLSYYRSHTESQSYLERILAKQKVKLDSELEHYNYGLQTAS
ncbi:hypothetical protein HRR83_004042 [Exophiala dermatitidis]|uniref:Uncharacterized protein n=1 Tax=Exophiala dermatitidis TaxID=5970 RepID=A0AAN6EK63_EXODE|nr:hypothetical protein HRR73_007685 [Exophiala dermatitidis]KAJ4521656.1 hypothetical protein HRR74_003481 [Exophiala dermatitidis]KAJ4531769.1 hypothetical protein HRR77_009178 [Exophiala dermatitidis]KAJ4545077.1 hypothetical protein HRR76_003107 [Exophiala dermatitidis]KAJ4554699.1 hypothetical protein HRR79_009413 [Exophiala dermatitidis]